MLGDIEMDDSSAMMSEHDENEEYTQACRGNREEIGPAPTSIAT
jgi:hypothetical protein